MRQARGGTSSGESGGGAVGGVTAPGKRALTDRLVQRKPAATGVVQRKVGWSLGGNNSGESAVGAMRRIPIEGLTTVGEAMGGRGIACFHSQLDPTRPIEVLLFLHGHNDGYLSKRDVARDQLEQQVEASGRVQMIGLMPQGSNKSDFSTTASRAASPQTKGFDSGAFITEAVGQLVASGSLAAAPPLPPANVVLGAHSGGGQAAGMMLESAPPPNLGEVVLFDAINGAGDELPRIEDWLARELERERTELVALPDDGARLAYLDTSFRFRAYHTSGGTYGPLHDANPADKQTFPGPDASGAPRKPTPLPAAAPKGAGFIPLDAFLIRWFGNCAGLSDTVVTRFRGNFRVIDTGVPSSDHDVFVGKGKLADELKALAPLTTGATPPPTPPPPPGAAAGGLGELTSTLGSWIDGAADALGWLLGGGKSP